MVSTRKELDGIYGSQVVPLKNSASLPLFLFFKACSDKIATIMGALIFRSHSFHETLHWSLFAIIFMARYRHITDSVADKAGQCIFVSWRWSFQEMEISLNNYYPVVGGCLAQTHPLWPRIVWGWLDCVQGRKDGWHVGNVSVVTGAASGTFSACFCSRFAAVGHWDSELKNFNGN